jgi:hypothetical protein
MTTPLKIPYRFILGLFLAAGLLSGCDHDTDPDGPNLVDRFGPFNVIQNLESNREQVDFSNGELVVFSAEFNKNIEWVITITGQSNGAVKTTEGSNRLLNAENATWEGGITDLPLFKEEMVTVILTVPEEPDYADTLEIDITGTRVYPGMVFWDFEEPAGSDISLGNFEFELSNNTGRQTMPVAAEGEYFWLMEGTDNVVPNFFVGLIAISPMVNDVTYVELPTLIPDNLYFNFFLYCDGRPHGIAVIQFAFDSNDNEVFDDGIDQTFQLEGDFPLDFEGWRLYSHTMAATGINAEQLEKIVAIRVILISDMNAQPMPPEQVQFGIDFMTFTSGAPLQL